MTTQPPRPSGSELRGVIAALRRAFLAAGAFGLAINLLLLMPAIYMLQIYDRVVSADALSDPRSGAGYYAMRVAVSGAELAKLGSLKLWPGMQATVMVKTGERSLMVYLMRPLLRRFESALSER